LDLFFNQPINLPPAQTADKRICSFACRQVECAVKLGKALNMRYLLQKNKKGDSLKTYGNLAIKIYLIQSNLILLKPFNSQ